MAFDNVRLKEEVDKVFAPEVQPNNLPIFFEYDHLRSTGMTSNSYHDTSFAQNLAKAHDSLTEEDYEKVAEAVAKDERINKFLPFIALDAMGANAFTSHASEANPNVDTDGAFGVSKAELEAASINNKHFDPVYRKGLTFAADNFDKFRSFDQKDGISLSLLGGDSNKWTISYKDLSQADEKLSDYQRAPRLIQAYESIRQIVANTPEMSLGSGVKLEHFQELVTPHNNNTSYGKSTPQQLWHAELPAEESVIVVKESSDYGITDINPEPQGDNALKVLDIRINDLKKEQASIAKLWGWEQK